MTRHLRAAALYASLTLAAGAADAQTVGIATSNPGSIYHSIGTAIANAANQAGLNTTIQPATSPNQFIPLLNSGGIEFGVANLQEINYAYEGKAWFEGQVNDSLRIVAMLMPLKEAIFVRADSGIMSVADLKGHPMVDGYTAQNTILPQLDAIYSTAGLGRADMTPVNVPSVTAGADAFMAGQADGFIFAHGSAKVREADASVGGLRALPVADASDAALAKARAFWPAAYFTTMKKGEAPGVLEDGTYFAYAQVIVANKDVPDDVVYQMVKAMYDGKEVMASTFPGFKPFDPKAMHGDPLAVPFHPGALKFFDENGM